MSKEWKLRLYLKESFEKKIDGEIKDIKWNFMKNKYYLYVEDVCKINWEHITGSHKFPTIKIII